MKYELECILTDEIMDWVLKGCYEYHCFCYTTDYRGRVRIHFDYDEDRTAFRLRFRI